MGDPRTASMLLLLPLLLALAGCPEPAASGQTTEPVQHVDIDDPKACEPCHETVVREWRESMHARAYDSKDPIYAGVRRVRMKKEGDEVAGACAPCHTPRFGGDLRAKAARDGVSCAGCHAVAAIKEAHDGPGVTRMIPTQDNILLGAKDPGPLAPGAAHGRGPAPAHMTDGDALCMACHESLSSPKGVAMCTTGPEHLASPEAGQRCVDCHMPELDGPSGVGTHDRKTHRSHRFLGPHRAWYQDDATLLASAAVVSGGLAGTTLTVRLANKSAHGVPTGFPGRMAALKLVGRDAGGAEVWTGPAAPVVLGKKYVDAAGKPVLAPYAARLASDTRLKPGETRELTFADVPEAVQTVQVALVWRLLPPPLAKKLGLEGKLEAEPRVVPLGTVRRK